MTDLLYQALTDLSDRYPFWFYFSSSNVLLTGLSHLKRTRYELDPGFKRFVKIAFFLAAGFFLGPIYTLIMCITTGMEAIKLMKKGNGADHIHKGKGC